MDQQKFRVYQRKCLDCDPYPHRYWLMTADELLQRVREDSARSDYDWITSATELVQTCSHPDFPDEAAAEIKDLVLNCFANLKSPGDSRGDQVAVFNCYTSSKNEGLKTRFLTRMIQRAIQCCFGDEVTQMFYHNAELEREFMQEKLAEFQKMEEEAALQSYQARYDAYIGWLANLSYEYDTLLDQAEKDGRLKPHHFFLTTNMIDF